MSFRTDYLLHSKNFDSATADFKNSLDFSTKSPEDITLLYSQV
jgi:hypothetical protein